MELKIAVGITERVMRCPGQDRRYWTGEVVFEAPCPQCGATVEMFKDESARRCPECGHRFQNPGMDFGCAQWCALAEQCLGFVPEGRVASDPRDGALAGRLIQYLGDTLRDEPARLAHALKAFHHAKELVAQEGGDPRIVIAAALLMPFRTRSGSGENAASAQPSALIKNILQTVGADDGTIRRVCAIVIPEDDKDPAEGRERTIVYDADALARLVVECSPGDRDKLETIIRTQLATKAAKSKARSWYEAVVAKDEDSGSESSP